LGPLVPNVRAVVSRAAYFAVLNILHSYGQKDKEMSVMIVLGAEKMFPEFPLWGNERRKDERKEKNKCL
jgi:hypothetical protein